MASKIYIGEDSLGQPVGYGDLIAVTRRARGSDTRREFFKGTVVGITPKNGFKIDSEDGTPIVDSWSKKYIVFPQNYTVLIVHADDLDKYRQSLVDWEQKNKEKAGN